MRSRSKKELTEKEKPKLTNSETTTRKCKYIVLKLSELNTFGRILYPYLDYFLDLKELQFFRD